MRAELGPIPLDLTFRQAAILACAAGLAYWLWQGSRLPTAFVAMLSLATLAVTLLAAFAPVAGRAADLWLRDLLHYAARPHQLAWQVAGAAAPGGEPSAAWVETPLALAWTPPRPAPAAD